MFTKVLPDYPVVVVVGLGSVKAAFNELDELHEKKENVRKATASAVSTIRSLDAPVTEIHFDPCDEAESVAIGAIVSEYRNVSRQRIQIHTSLRRNAHKLIDKHFSTVLFAFHL